MKPALARRQAALAGVALVGALGAIALTRIGDDPEPPPRAVVEWREARVGILTAAGEITVCDVTLTASTVGVAHPVLPCGAELLLEHEDRRARAEVVARGTVEGGHDFDVTPTLARRLGVEDEAVVRWRFAG